jgi:hypothetical protein
MQHASPPLAYPSHAYPPHPSQPTLHLRNGIYLNGRMVFLAVYSGIDFFDYQIDKKMMARGLRY